MKKTLLALMVLMVLSGCGNQGDQVQTPSNLVMNQEVNETTTLTSMKDEADVSPIMSSVINSEASYLDWKGGKIVGGDHWGTVKIKSAEIDMADGKVEAGKIVVDMSTISITDIQGPGADKLLGKFMGEEFFMVDTYPEAVMEFDTVNYTDETTAEAMGNLTIKDTKKPLTFTFNQLNDRITTEFIMDRTEWNIRYGSGKFFDNLGDNVIKDEIEFKVTLVMNPMIETANEETIPVESDGGIGETNTGEILLESRIEQ